MNKQITQNYHLKEVPFYYSIYSKNIKV